MTIPVVSDIKHIPYIKLQSYFTKKYNLPSDGHNDNRQHYDDHILKSHMFRGNDSSMGFFNSFLNEMVDKEVLEHFHFLDKALLDGLVQYDNEADIEDWIRNYGVDNWAREYKKLLQNKDQVLNNLNEDDQYWWGYFINGIYTSMVISLYQLEDVTQYNYYYWYFSW